MFLADKNKLIPWKRELLLNSREVQIYIYFCVNWKFLNTLVFVTDRKRKRERGVKFIHLCTNTQLSYGILTGVLSHKPKPQIVSIYI